MTWFSKKRNMPKLKLELKQKKIEELVEIMLESNLESHYSPLHNEYFILDKENDLGVCISEGYIKISNHNYLYEMPLSLKSYDTCMKKIRDSIESKTEKIKKDFFKNEIGLISNLLKIYD